MWDFFPQFIILQIAVLQTVTKMNVMIIMTDPEDGGNRIGQELRCPVVTLLVLGTFLHGKKNPEEEMVGSESRSIESWNKIVLRILDMQLRDIGNGNMLIVGMKKMIMSEWPKTCLFILFCLFQKILQFVTPIGAKLTAHRSSKTYLTNKYKTVSNPNPKNNINSAISSKLSK